MSQYKIILDSNDTNCYMGSQFNAKYYVNTTDMLSNPLDENKKYSVVVNLRSIANYSSVNDLNQQEVYVVNISFNKPADIYRYSQSKNNYSCLVGFEYDYGTYKSLTTGFDIDYSTKALMSIKQGDNAPFTIPNLKSINTIDLTFIKTSNDTILTVTDETKSRYVCILTLTEIE